VELTLGQHVSRTVVHVHVFNPLILSLIRSLIQPPLSLEQEKRGTTWQLLASGSISEQEDAKLCAHDVEQRTVTDCSVCASIITCLEHRGRFDSQVASSVNNKDLYAF
jgi:hypothetical protein